MNEDCITDAEANAALDQVRSVRRERIRTFRPPPEAIEVSHEMWQWLTLHYDADGYTHIITFGYEISGDTLGGEWVGRLFGIRLRETDNEEAVRIVA